MKPLLCFAHGQGDEWEAICLDLDLAVQGRSYEEVYEGLNRAVGTYIQDALKEKPDVTRKLLRRKAPWHVRAGYIGSFVLSTLLSRDTEQRHGYTLPCAA